MKRRRAALLILLPFLFSSCGQKKEPTPPDPGPIDVETTTYSFFINDETDNPYVFTKDQLIHDGFTQYNYKNIPELNKGDTITFQSQKGESISAFTPLLTGNNNLYNDPNTNTYYVITTCVLETLTLNVYKEYISAYLSGYSVAHNYSVTYNETKYEMNDVSDTKTRKDSWLMKYNASFRFDIESPFVFFEDDTNLCLSKKVEASKQENNNAYEVEDEENGRYFMGYNFTPEATMSLLIYQNHYEVFMSGNESSTYVSLIGTFDSLEQQEIRMPYVHETDTASKTVRLNYADKFLVNIDRSGERPVSLGYDDLVNNSLAGNFGETDRTIELTCLKAGTYTISAKLEDKKITITGTPDVEPDSYYAIFVNKTRYQLTEVNTGNTDVKTYRSQSFDVEANDAISALSFANALNMTCEVGYNNLVKQVNKYYAYVSAKNVTFTLNVDNTTHEASARLSGYVPAYSLVMLDKFDAYSAPQVFDLVLNEDNAHADEYEEYVLENPISVLAYRSIYLNINNSNVTPTLYDEETNNLEVANVNSGEFMIKCDCNSATFTARVYNYGEQYQIFMSGYDADNYYPAVNLLIYDDSSSNIVRLKQDKSYVSLDGEIQFKGVASIAQGQYFAFIHHDRVPYMITTWDTSTYYSVIEEEFNYFHCEKDIIDKNFIIQVNGEEARFILS